MKPLTPRRWFFQNLLVILVFIVSGLPLMAQSPPTATTGAASGIGQYEASLNGVVNANGLSTTVTFEYGTTTGYGNTFTAAQSPVTGTTDTAVSTMIYELQPDTTYHYRVTATNADGTTYGADMTFTTQPLPPGVNTGAATNIGVDSATLNGTVTPRNLSTDVWFEWGTGTSYGNTVNSVITPVSGNNTWPAQAAISGLASNTTYHFRVVAQNSAGTSYGEDKTFTIAGSPPTAVTGAPSNITSKTAQFNGTVNANGSETTVTFEWGTTTAYGNTNGGTPSPLYGTSDTAVSIVIDDFVPNTTYHYRIVATSSAGTVYGSDMSFTTLPDPPTAATGIATAIGNTGAALNGSVNANDGSATVTFEYGLDTNYGSTVTADQSPVTGSSATTVSKTISGLANNTVYHYRVVAVNAGGTTYGADMTFTTGVSAPTATTNAATSVGITGATLNGTVNANNGTTAVSFQYGTSVSYDRTATAIPASVTGSGDTAVQGVLNDLNPNTTYHFRVVAENASGTVYGADMTFTTKSPPTVTTNAAAGVSDTGATLNGTVNANGESTVVTIQYGTTTAYGSTVTAGQSPVTGSAATAVSKTITGLSPNTTYHYRVVGQNASGTTYGADMTFYTVNASAPTATTNAATSILSDGATLNGTVNANNADTTVTFEYGTTTAYGTTVTADQSPVSGAANTAASKTITGLSNNTTYHYRIVAQNAQGTTFGADMTFQTGNAPTAVTSTATGVGGSGATLNGMVNANNFGTTVTFEYGTTTSYGSTVSASPSFVSGTDDTAVSAVLTGLSPNTTYHFRVKAQGFGTTYGADMTFTTSSQPTVATNAAAAVNTTGATLNGTVNAQGHTLTVTFQYGLNTNYGKTVTANQSPVSGTANTAVSAAVQDLVPNTTYHFRVVGTTTNDTVYGSDMTFTTGGSVPAASTSSATAINETGATLNGVVKAKNDSTTVTFEYGTTTAYGTTVTAPQSPVSGNNNQSVSAVLTGLTSGTTYHYRVVAVNSSGTANGADMTFTTGSLEPSATTNAATSVTSTTASLHGVVNANSLGTTVTFEFGPDTSYGRTATASQSPVTGTTDTAVSVDIDSLSPNTTYHFRVVAVNASGTAYGADMTFFTGPEEPDVTTQAATSVGSDSAVLNGLVTANNADTTVTFQYGTDTSYGTTVSGTPGTVTGTGETAVNAAITGLDANTAYHFRVVGQNSQGTVYGADMMFTTSASNLPTVTTAEIRKITYKSAKGGGEVTEEGAAPVTARGVVWSTSPNPTLSDSKTVNDYGLGVFNSNIKPLTPETTYYVRAYATNSFGTAYGEERMFTTTGEYVVKVKINQPKDGREVSGTVKIQADAHMNKANSSGKRQGKPDSIAKVEFFIDDAKVAEFNKPPYKYNWDSTGATGGNHTIKAVATGTGGQVGEDMVTVVVNNTPPAPEIATNRGSFCFSAVPKGKHGFRVTGGQKLLIRNSGGGELDWSISADTGWISVSRTSGAGKKKVTVFVDPTGMSSGSYNGNLTITAVGASNGPVIIPVKLTIYAARAASPPFGAVDTPESGVTVSNNITISGWVLDDIEVGRVAIYRLPVGSESGKLIFIGDAQLVEDARPDVEAAHPGYPANYQAGWGYMLVTGFLPEQGNGTYTIVAKATDIEGNTVEIGSKTITVDNTNAVKPWGGLETPAQGEVVGGSGFVVSGWALAHRPNSIPVDGSTITVWIDGVAVGHPVYNQFRQDIADQFPGLVNSGGAGGSFILDTTLYSNGRHTIAWTVEDTGGNVGIIGSRYFEIENENDGETIIPIGVPVRHLIDLGFFEPSETNSSSFISGYRPGDTLFPLSLDEKGNGFVIIEELQRIQLKLGDNLAGAWGYYVNGDRLFPLPEGSALDQRTGVFTWTPGPGYIGNYQLVFIVKDTGGVFTRTQVNITVEPEYKK